jgi:hypothetical protein
VAGLIGLERADFIVSIDVAVVWRGHVEISPQDSWHLAVVHGNNPLRSDQPEHVSDSVLSGQSAAMTEARPDGRLTARFPSQYGITASLLLGNRHHHEYGEENETRTKDSPHVITATWIEIA